MYMFVQKHMAIDNKDRTGISCLHVFLREQLGISMLYFCVLVCSLSD